MMKKLSYLVMPLIITLFACNMSNKEDKTSTEEFSDFAKEEGFAEKHAEPQKVASKNLGEMTTFTIEGEEGANVYQIKNETPTNKYLFIIHEWWGLNEHIKIEADKWYTDLGNVNVLALDLYDGKVADTREKAQEYMSGADEERIQKIINAALSQLPEDAELATIGWCYGGGWSLRTALQAGNLLKACVMYYGMPISDAEKLKNLNSEVLFIYGTQDQWINEQVVEDFKLAMKTAKKELTVLSFEADHAFANPSGDHYLEDAAQDANQKAKTFLEENL